MALDFLRNSIKIPLPSAPLIKFLPEKLIKKNMLLFVTALYFILLSAGFFSTFPLRILLIKHTASNLFKNYIQNSDHISSLVFIGSASWLISRRHLQLRILCALTQNTVLELEECVEVISLIHWMITISEYWIDTYSIYRKIN